ncbi:MULTISPECIES: hypothetical protein [Streptomyces]|uniref:Uncharacterized protein n=1 Tax=Streptomyces zinciresistens K42 TaxID=700597 RepID=G2GIC0_9ACTN|nr:MULTISPECIES: hypothetical protein [Streptomyces]EGX56739.1 hypothetical protein SZN_26301 [Streptomyces zinciresistens K42]MDT9700132.1 hypothetical protein [Streptomyces sp. P17]
MTNPRNREHDRAVRQYKREHPGITLDQARQAVAARSGQQPSLPARIPAAPLPRPAERLEGYIQRVAAAAGVQRHRAMELLGLAPGTSATERLDELAAGPLPDHTVRALTAATGMTADQARALTTPLPARPDPAAVRHMTEAAFAAGHFRRGGEGKTSTSTDLSAALARTFAQRAHMTDLDSQHTLLSALPVDELRQAPYTPVFVDLDWPADATRPPIDPEVFDEVAKALGIGQDTDADAPPSE